eukprot:5475771-Amphidinium_carterae.1
MTEPQVARKGREANHSASTSLTTDIRLLFPPTGTKTISADGARIQIVRGCGEGPLEFCPFACSWGRSPQLPSSDWCDDEVLCFFVAATIKPLPC